MKTYLLTEEQMLALNPIVKLENYDFAEHPNVMMRCDVESVLDRKGIENTAQREMIWKKIKDRAEKELGSLADVIIQEEI